RIIPQGSNGGRSRSAAEGRLHAEPHSPDDFRRRHPSYHYGIEDPGAYGPLTSRSARPSPLPALPPPFPPPQASGGGLGTGRGERAGVRRLALSRSARRRRPF